ncbi:hypothetical protein Pla52n_14280 [Stieleria varia]|uniref:Secreted protein n=1 Tax=Stieleria varia TaxID=2528005 RepID=A0A5C6B0L9_9BACT|nr:hypothetical protein Pla52n_14280 [Stieleria varia]
MRKISLLLMTASCCFVLSFSGCGSSGNTVVEAPPEVVEDQPAMEGMTDEEYNKAMEADMRQ